MSMSKATLEILQDGLEIAEFILQNEATSARPSLESFVSNVRGLIGNQTNSCAEQALGHEHKRSQYDEEI
jgi:hypothetical protein